MRFCKGMPRNKAEAGDEVKVCLLMDATHIRKHADGGSAIVSGYVTCGDEFLDMGFGKSNTNRTLGTQALVLVVVGINDTSRLPVAYFPINSISAVEQSSLVTTRLTNLHDIGVDVEGLPFGGHPTNITTGMNMGAWLYAQTHQGAKPLKVNFPHPSTKKPVNIMQDACHVLKLSWNALGDKGHLRGSCERDAHLQNTAVAAQTLSGSTAEAIAICREDLKLP